MQTLLLTGFSPILSRRSCQAQSHSVLHLLSCQMTIYLYIFMRWACLSTSMQEGFQNRLLCSVTSASPLRPPLATAIVSPFPRRALTIILSNGAPGPSMAPRRCRSDVDNVRGPSAEDCKRMGENLYVLTLTQRVETVTAGVQNRIKRLWHE